MRTPSLRAAGSDSCSFQLGSQDGKQRFLGGFDTKEEAARAYDEFSVAERGLEAARRVGLNFPEEWVTGEGWVMI